MLVQCCVLLLNKSVFHDVKTLQVDDPAAAAGGNVGTALSSSGSSAGNNGAGNSTSGGNGNLGGGSAGLGSAAGNGGRNPAEPLNDIEKYLNIRRQVINFLPLVLLRPCIQTTPTL